MSWAAIFLFEDFPPTGHITWRNVTLVTSPGEPGSATLASGSHSFLSDTLASVKVAISQ